jgi:hypothetical protein
MHRHPEIAHEPARQKRNRLLADAAGDRAAALWRLDRQRCEASFQGPTPAGAGNPLFWGTESHVMSLLGDAFDLEFVSREMSQVAGCIRLPRQHLLILGRRR